MTSFVPIERRGNKKDVRNLAFDGPQKEYMGSLARLFEGAQVLGKSLIPHRYRTDCLTFSRWALYARVRNGAIQGR